ncbi:glycosyltransferase family 39 protein [Streptomyces bambusae]|nr:glycosyltransferase family 39 protein [Streptomyces bambusae]
MPPAAAVPLVPVLAALALGLWGLSRGHSLWRDEAATWQSALRTVPEIWHMLGQVDAVHGLYYFFVHGLFTVFGDSTTTLRLPSVLAVAAAAGFTALTGARTGGRWAGLAAGLTVALLPAMQFHAQEGRPYALVTAGAAASGWLLVRALDGPGPGRRPMWAGYGLLLLGCALLNWFSLLVAAAHAATLAWVRADRALLRRWAAAVACAVAGALPLVLFSRSQSGQVSWIPPTTWHTLAGPGALLLAGGACALVRGPRAGRPAAPAVGLPLLVVPQLALLAASLAKPLYLERYVLFSMLGLALLAGHALGALVRATARRSPRAAALVVPVAALAAFAALLPLERAERAPGSRADDVFAVAGEVAAAKRPGDAVLFLPAARRDTALVSPEAFAGVADIALVRTPAESGTLKGVEGSQGRLRVAMLGRQRILLVTDARPRLPGNALDRLKLRVLRQHFRVETDLSVRGRRLTVYERLPGQRDGDSHRMSGT